MPHSLFTAEIETLTATLIGVACAVVGIVVGAIGYGLLTSRTIAAARREGESVRKAAEAEGQQARARIELEAEKKAQQRRSETEKEMNRA